MPTRRQRTNSWVTILVPKNCKKYVTKEEKEKNCNFLQRDKDGTVLYPSRKRHLQLFFSININLIITLPFVISNAKVLIEREKLVLYSDTIWKEGWQYWRTFYSSGLDRNRQINCHGIVAARIFYLRCSTCLESDSIFHSFVGNFFSSKNKILRIRICFFWRLTRKKFFFNSPGF